MDVGCDKIRVNLGSIFFEKLFFIFNHKTVFLFSVSLWESIWRECKKEQFSRECIEEERINKENKKARGSHNKNIITKIFSCIAKNQKITY